MVDEKTTACSFGFGRSVGDYDSPERSCIASSARAGTLRGRCAKSVSQAQGKRLGDTGVYVVKKNKDDPPKLTLCLFNSIRIRHKERLSGGLAAVSSKTR